MRKIINVGGKMTLWGALWQYHNKKDGLVSTLLNENGLPKLFRTRKEARTWINQEFSYIRRRRDLQREPHGWKMPIPVLISIEY